MSSRQTQIATYDGAQATVRHLDNTADGRRLKVKHPDGREWIVGLALPEGDVDVEVTRRDGEPSDLNTPEWLVDQLGQLAAPA